MDEIMAAMVLTSLSCSPVVQSPPQRDLLPGDLASFGNHILPNKEHFFSVCLFGKPTQTVYLKQNLIKFEVEFSRLELTFFTFLIYA